MNLSKYIVVNILLLVALTSTTWAGQYVVSLGAISAPDYEGSEDYATIPALSLRGNYENGRYFTLGPNFKFNLIPSKTFNFGPLLNYRQARDNVDNQQVDKLKDVDAAFEAGAFGSVNFNNFTLGLEILTDISDQHDGTLVKATAGYRWRVTKDLMLSPSVYSTYADDNYMATYFGVSSANRGTSTLPDFAAEGGIKDVGINILALYSTPWPQWGIAGIFNYKKLLGDAKDSPIVSREGNDSQLLLGLMATYRWEI